MTNKSNLVSQNLTVGAGSAREKSAAVDQMPCGAFFAGRARSHSR